MIIKNVLFYQLFTTKRLPDVKKINKVGTGCTQTLDLQTNLKTKKKYKSSPLPDKKKKKQNRKQRKKNQTRAQFSLLPSISNFI